MAKDFIRLSADFFKKHWIDISLASLGIFLIVSYIVLHNIIIDPPRSLKKGRTIVVEPLQDMGPNVPKAESANKMTQDAFCKAGQMSHTLEEKCNALSPAVCQETECCVYVHKGESPQLRMIDAEREDLGLSPEYSDENPDGGFSCVTGNGFNGPTYKGDENGSYYAYDYWYYLGKKYPM
jgi:hypothetical protein